jgi:hypothetical protein
MIDLILKNISNLKVQQTAEEAAHPITLTLSVLRTAVPNRKKLE